MENGNIQITTEDLLFNNELELLSNNLTNSLSLRKVYFDDEKISYLIKAMENSKIIKKIRLYNCDLDDEKASLIFQAFKNIKTLENIDLTHNYIKSDSLKVLNDSILGMPKLKRLNLYKNLIDDDGLYAISEIIKKSKKLIEINIGNNKFSEFGLINYLADSLEENLTLENLNLSWNYISEDAIKAITNKLISKKDKINLRIINLNRCKISDRSCIYLGNLLKANLKLDELNLNENNISSNGLRYISEGLKYNHHIKTISFEYNKKIGDIGIYHFTNSLKYNKSFRDLILKNLIYGNMSFENISTLLSINHQHLMNLNISNNYISSQGIELISNSLEINNRLKSVSFDYCGLKSDGISMIFDSLSRNKHSQIYFVSVEGNIFDISSAYSLSNLLKNENKTIKNLVLKNCQIKTEVAKIVFKSLNITSDLFVLDISRNFIEDDAVNELSLALKNNTKLNYLYLNGNNITDLGIVKICESLRANKNFELTMIEIGDMNISQHISDELEEILIERKEKKELEEIVENELVKIQIFK